MHTGAEAEIRKLDVSIGIDEDVVRLAMVERRRR